MIYRTASEAILGGQDEGLTEICSIESLEGVPVISRRSVVSRSVKDLVCVFSVNPEVLWLALQIF